VFIDKQQSLHYSCPRIATAAWLLESSLKRGVIDEWRRRRRAAGRLLVLAAFAGALAGSLFAAAPANAHFSSGLYSHEGGDCASRINPIGAIFYRFGGTQNAANHTAHHTGWGSNIDNPQWFATHGVCYERDGSLASASAWDPRYHIRLRQTYHGDTSFGTTTVGTPHWEEECGTIGHAVPPNGFTRGRRQLVDHVGILGGHDYYYEYWGNTQPFPQGCHGWVAEGDGVVVWLRID
jgi:hypothetical protein